MKNKPYFGVYLFYWMAYAVLLPYIGIIYKQKGLTGSQIGVMSVLEAVIIPVAGGMVGLILGRVKKIKWFIALLPLLCMLSAIGLYLSEGIFALICSAGCLYFFQTPINDATDRLLIARLGNNANRFSNYRLGGSGGYGIGALLGSAITMYFSYNTLFFAYCAIMLLALGCILLLPIPKDIFETKENKRKYSLFCLINNKFIYIYGTMLLYGFIEAAYGKFMALHIIEQGFSTTLMGYMIAFTMIGEFLIFVLFPKITKHISVECQLMISFFLGMLRLCSLTFISWFPMPVLFICQLLGGGAFAILYSTVTVLIEQTYPNEIGFAAQALKNIASNGIGYVLGSISLGIIYEQISLYTGYRLHAFVSIMAFFVFCLMFIKKKTLKGHA
jgi:PPP family 3-phenylpropionic acid transporter